MMNKVNFSALLTQGKNAMGFVRDKVANLFGGKTLLDVKQLEELISNLSIDDRLALAKSINLNSLFRVKRFDLLLRLGQIEEMVNKGFADEIIAGYPVLRQELGKKIYEHAIALITEEMLNEYLKKRDNNLDFFILHPLGLRVLAANEYSGYIAANETEFRRIADDFPEEFRLFPDARREYIALLKKYLD